MENFDQLDDVIERIQSNRHTPKDIDFLRGLLKSGSPQAISQLGKFNVHLGEAEKIHIGDQNYYGFDQDLNQALVNAIQALSSSITKQNQFSTYPASEPLEELSLDVDQQSIQRINIELNQVESLQKSGYLSPEDRQTFDGLKQKVRQFNQFDRELKQLVKEVEALLKQAADSLKQHREQLLSTSQNLQTESSFEIHCIDEQIELIGKLRMNLDEAKLAADWLEQDRANLAERIGRKALEGFEGIDNDPDRISDFYFSIEQYIARISHCLQWGRANILDSSDIPFYFDVEVYTSAFTYLKGLLPKRFTESAKKQTLELIDYLIEQLPTYR